MYTTHSYLAISSKNAFPPRNKANILQVSCLVLFLFFSNTSFASTFFEIFFRNVKKEVLQTFDKVPITNIELENVLTPIIAEQQQPNCQNENNPPPITSSGFSSTSSTTYQWQMSIISCTSGFSDIAGATANSYDPPTINQTHYYRLLVNLDGSCANEMSADTSNCLILIPDTNCPPLCVAPTVTVRANQEVCSNFMSNNLASISINAATNASRYNVVMGSDYSAGDGDFFNATAFNPSTDLPLQILAFLFPNGSQDYTVRVFNGSSECFTDVTVTIQEQICTTECGKPTLGADQASCGNLSGCIGGYTFEDFNCNGTEDATESGLGGIEIYVYDCNNNLAGSTISDAEGQWEVCGLTDEMDYRVEHVLPEAVSCWATPTHVGTDNQSDIQFLTAPACTQFSVSNPDDYCEENPRLGISCFINGSGVGNTRDGFVTFSYDAYSTGDNSGVPDMFLSGTNVENPSKDAEVQEIGAVWGGEWQAKTKRVFLSAFSKRHVAYGPRGADGVYVIDYSGATPSITGGFDLQGISTTNGGTIDLGTIQRTYVTGAISNDDELSDTPSEQNIDLFAFDAVGKTSFGDLEFEDDMETLWLVNLKQQALIKVDLSNYTPSLANPTILSSAVVDQYLLSNMPNMPVCNNGNLRPWGLKFYKGRAYLGLVCDASISQSGVDLNAYVVSFDPAAPYAGVNVELNFNMDYIREKTDNSILNGFWGPWISTWSQVQDSEGRQQPQPIISNIDFTDDGSMVIGVMDRFGNQIGVENYIPESGTSESTFLVVFGTGDILHACNDGNSGWSLEGAGTCAISDVGIANSQTDDGPSGLGEYYFNDYFDRANPTPDGTYNHGEISTGAVLVVKGKNTVINTVYDPISDNRLFREGTFTQGLHYYNTTNAAKTGAYTLVDRTDLIEVEEFSKANGLGELFSMCNPAPLEIGNYVWCDSIKNGIQDACERGIKDINVSLYDENGLLVGLTQTSNSGNYFFNQSNVDITGVNPDGTAVTAFTGMNYSTQYFIVFGDGQFTTDEFTVGGSTYGISSMTNVGSNDNIDSDVDGSSLSTAANGAANLPFIDMTTSATGCGEHKYDMGLTCSCALTITQNTPSICNNNGTDTNAADDYFTIDFNASAVNGGAQYEIVLNANSDGTGGTVLATSDYGTAVTVGSPTTFYADGTTTYDITVRDATTNICHQDYTPPLVSSCSNTCTLNNGNLKALTCNNNATGADASDDYLTFTLSPTGTNISTAYNVTVSSGTITPSSTDYCPTTTFQLQDGSAGAGDVMVTITDSNSPACSFIVLIADPGACQRDADYPDYNRPNNPCSDAPCHFIDNDIYLGSSVTADSGVPSDENADADVDDGISILPNMQFIAGNTVRIPVSIYNNTNNAAYLRMWIDWNGDGDFTDSGEQVENSAYSATGGANTVFVSVTIPTNAMQTQSIALRTRLSTDDVNSASPCGNGNCADDGEVEDYLISISCSTSVCPPVELSRRN